MQLFIVSKDPVVCARYLDDRRCNKIILEAGQMMCDAIRTRHSSVLTTLYNLCRPKHPCTQWVGRSRENFLWTLAYWRALNKEKYRRFGRWHSAWDRFSQGITLGAYIELFPSAGLTVPANCARKKELGLDFTHIKSVTLAYRMYLDARWRLECETNYAPRAALRRNNASQRYSDRTIVREPKHGDALRGQPTDSDWQREDRKQGTVLRRV